MITIQPCPYPHKRVTGDVPYIVAFYRYEGEDVCVYCPQCEAQGPMFPFEHDAIAAWNAVSDAVHNPQVSMMEPVVREMKIYDD